MKVLTGEDGELVITENYIGVLMQASDQSVGICERDGGFEVGVYQPDGSHVWYSIMGGEITPMVCLNTGDEDE